MTQPYPGNPTNPNAPRGVWVCDDCGEAMRTVSEAEKHLAANGAHACTFKIAGREWSG